METLPRMTRIGAIPPAVSCPCGGHPGEGGVGAFFFNSITERSYSSYICPVRYLGTSSSVLSFV